MRKLESVKVLDTLETRVERHLKKTITVYQNLSADQLLKPSATGGWSIAQCLDHLNRYGDYYLPQIEKQLEKKGNGANEIFNGSWLGSYFTRMMEPTTGTKKIKAFKAYAPPPDMEPYAVVAKFIQQQEQLLNLLNRARQVNLDGLKIPVSIARWIRLRLGDVFQFLIAHNERHIVQADRNL